MKQGRSLQELAIELDRRANTKRDFVADTRKLELMRIGDDENAKMALHVHDQGFFAPNQLMHQQVATWSNIPAKYYDRMMADAPDLLIANVNHWFHETSARRMVRTLDGTARAFLSDRYRRIDNEDIAEVALPILTEMPDIQIASAEVTERKLFIKAVFPRVEGEVTKGDVVQAGIVISNSEVGLGSVSVAPLIYRLVCDNGMIANDYGVRKYHVGRQSDSDAAVAELFADDTNRADDQALILKLRDVIRATADESRFGKMLDKMREAAESPAIPVENAHPAVEALGQTIGLTQNEKGSVLRSLIQGNDYTKWGAVNAVTSIANDTESYDRASELEMLGGRLLDLPSNQWQQIASAT